MKDRIQEGVHFRSGEKPPAHFAIAFVDFVEPTDSSQVQAHLQSLWDLFRHLKVGGVRDLPGLRQGGDDLCVLLGFGRSMFVKAGITETMPVELKGFRAPAQEGGGPLSLGSGIGYASDVRRNPANADIAFQFTASSALTANRAVVELWKFVHDVNTSGTREVLRISGAFTGFGREDKRSWIDFFDGTSNLRADQRLDAIEIKPRLHPALDKWKEHGTYLCFMRLSVDIGAWRLLTRAQQERLVGRDKMTGCALVSADGETEQPAAGCPMMSNGTVEDGMNEAFRDAPRPPGSKTLRESHIHRCNHGRATASDPESRRVFRQGYEFLDGINEMGAPRLGLNFVSFQDSPERILLMLKLADWLGGVNFGGSEDEQLPGMASLLSARAAGFFVVPPRRDDERFPGWDVFMQQA